MKKPIYEVNKGKICKNPSCNFNAKIKGFCNHCYVNDKKKKKERNESLL